MLGMDDDQLEQLPEENFIGVSQKAECGKFKKPRLFPTGEAQGKLLNRYHDCATRASASMTAGLPGVNPSAMEALLKGNLMVSKPWINTLGGGFNIFLFSLLFGEDSHFD